MISKTKKYESIIFILVFLLVSLIFLSFFSPKKASCREDFKINSRSTLLENGLELITVEKCHTPMVSLVLIIKAGAAYPIEFSAAGTAHFVEHMLFKGSAKYTEEQINQEFSAMGGYINAYTTFDYTAVYLSVLRQHFDEALEILTDMVFNSEFMVQDVEKERLVILNEINLNLDEPPRRLTRELFLTAYQKSPYRYPIIGYRDLFARLSRDDLYNFYKRYYCPDNMVLAIVGDVNSIKAEKLVKKKFGAYKRKGLPQEISITEPRQVSFRRKDVDFPIPVSKIVFAYQGVDIFNKDLFALDSLSVICAGMPGSILETELVEKKKIALEVNAYNYTPEHKGLFVITVDCEPRATEEVIRSVNKIMNNLGTKGVSHAQLSKARNYFLTDYYKRLETNEGLAKQIAIDYALVGDSNFSAAYLKSIGSLNVAQLKKAASRYFKNSNLTVVVLSEKGKQEKYKEQFSQVDKTLPSKELGRSIPVDKTPPSGESGRSIPMDKPLLKTLPGGLRVILKEDRNTPLLTFRVTYLGGLGSEVEPFWGISNLTASLFFEGTKSYNKDRIDDFLSSRGAFYTTYSGNNSFGFSVELPCEYAKDAFKLIEEIVLEATFPSTQLEKQKRIIKAAIEKQHADIFRLGYLTLKESLYAKNCPFYYAKLGSLKSVELLERKDVMDYYQKHLIPSQIVVGVFGNFDCAQIMPYLKKISFALAKKGTKFQSPQLSEGTSLLSKEKITKYLPKKQSMVLVGFKTMSVKSNDKYALEVLTKIISGSGARLYKSIRIQKGFSYTLGAFNTYGLDKGFYTIYVATTKDHTEEIIASIEKEIALLKKSDVPTEELERAKQAIIGEYLRGLQANTNFSFTCSLDELYGFGYDFYDKYPNHIKQVSAQDIRKIAEKYFKKSATVVVLGH